VEPDRVYDSRTGIFLQLRNPDLFLRFVFAIRYLNVLASGYFIYLLFRYGHHFQPL